MSLGQIVKDIYSCVLWLEFICSPRNIQSNLIKKDFKIEFFLRNRKGFYLPPYKPSIISVFDASFFPNISELRTLFTSYLHNCLHTFHFNSQKYVSLWPFLEFFVLLSYHPKTFHRFCFNHWIFYISSKLVILWSQLFKKIFQGNGAVLGFVYHGL